MNQLFPPEEINLKLYCPQCDELLSFQAKRCKYCCEEIDEDRGKLSGTIYYVLTSATSFANTIATNDPAVVFYLGSTLISLWLKSILQSEGELFYVWVGVEIFNIIWFMPVVAIQLWFLNFGNWNISDDDYEQKKGKCDNL